LFETDIKSVTRSIFTTRCNAEHGIATTSKSSVCLSVTLRYRDHISCKFSEIISHLVTLECSLSADPTPRIYSKGSTIKFRPKVTQPPVEMSVADIRWQIAAEWQEITMVTMGIVWKNHLRYFQWYDR